MTNAELLDLLRLEVIPTMGCTDPAAIALAAAHAVSVTTGEVKGVELLLSNALFKNARSVGIPNTDCRGIEIAALLGLSMSNPRLDLKIFSTLTIEDLKRAALMKSKIPIRLHVEDSLDSIYVEVAVTTSHGLGKAIIESRHNNLVLLKWGDKILLDNRLRNSKNHEDHPRLKAYLLENIIGSALKLPADLIHFLLEGADMNLRIAQKASTAPEMQIGPAFQRAQSRPYADQGGIGSEIAALTAAACEARMNGVMLPTMSCAGSGNQGLVAILPIAVAGEKLASGSEKITYSLAISHLVTIYVKEHTGRLSPICGCAVAAGAGAAAGLTYLLGGGISAILQAVGIVISTMVGMICDGAKEGCALKVWSAASMAWQAALLALEGYKIPEGSGIVGADIKKTLENLERISTMALTEMDKTLIDCFVHSE